ncbi:MAG: HNH endonuclease, partial [Geodermatophilaceae bacterium]|nr:HNH endonuclease [Geodermatophilaceae bacterium]
LGTAGQVLDLGRTQRLFTASLRRALNLRDQGCAFPGCDRPPAWCDGHHIVSWADGGQTSLANGVLLCGHHHAVVHRDHWTIHVATDGVPEFTPPAWIDPIATPRRNRRQKAPDP